MLWLEQHQDLLRISVFLGTLSLMLAWERFQPARTDARTFEGGSSLKRRANNLILTFVNSAVLRLVPAISASYTAYWASENQIGLFHTLNLPVWFVLFAGILLMDMAIYWQHRLMHRVPVLWRLHRVHHSDLDFDTTTALRFHPIEIALSMAYKSLLVLALGLPLFVVIIFEIILNAAALFNHGNVSLPNNVERRLRKAIVTPDMHRVHHSVLQTETDSNFGFFLSIWDRLFSSYIAYPKQSTHTMPIGLEYFREKRLNTLASILWMPFRKHEPSGQKDLYDRH